MDVMSASYWNRVLSDGLVVPSDRPLDDLTAELTRMLGSPDPALRDGTAYPALSTWIDRGVYDHLLAGLGDGMAAGLKVGLGDRDTDTVFRRAFSVLVLAECIDRDNARALVPSAKIFDWGDRVATWYLREADVRGFVPGKGWAHTVAHGADAIGALAESPHFATSELTVLLDVLADRVLLPVDHVFANGEPDRIAMATMRLLRRNIVPLSVLEPWVARLAAAAARSGTGTDGDPFLATGNAEAYLRALYLQLSLGGAAPAVRSDLLLVLVDALKATNPHYLRPTP
ncbi:MAG: hypothetical protein JWN22_3668 [Nocardioides sp.]|jgi:hypothetical protein|nr:hypothetical protein [Nocardioides sp.]